MGARIGYRAPASPLDPSDAPGGSSSRCVKVGRPGRVEVLAHLNDTVPEPLVQDTPATGVTFGLRLQRRFFRRGAMPAWMIVTLKLPLIPA